MAQNDITGDEIKSRAYSEAARKRHGEIFSKRTFEEWCQIEKIDAFIDTETFNKKMNYPEFRKIIKDIWQK